MMNHLLSPVKDRSLKLLPAFLNILIPWAKTATDEIFAARRDDPMETDIYTSIKSTLAPDGWKNLLHRKAALCEVGRVLAGFESSWNFSEGRDVKNTSVSAPLMEIETGIFQVSANSMNFGADLRGLVVTKLGTTAASMFIDGTKSHKEFAIEYGFRLLRHTVRHNGPVLRREIHEYLNIQAVEDFKQLLQ